MRSNSNTIPTHELYDRFERSIPFDLLPLEKKSSYDTFSYHRHAYYEMFLFFKGGGKHDIDFETYHVEDNTLHFVSPGQVHMLQRELDSEGFVLLFSREFYHLGSQNTDSLYELPFLHTNTLSPILKISPELLDTFKLSFTLMKEENEANNQDKAEVLRAHLTLLMLKVKRHFLEQNKNSIPNANPHSDLIKKFRVAIEKNFLVLHKPAEYAELLHVSAGHLNDIVKDMLGVSSSDLINERILLEIKRMLFHSDETVSEIAQVLNFEDVSYFSRFFKTHVGSTPKDFRMKIREKYQ